MIRTSFRQFQAASRAATGNRSLITIIRAMALTRVYAWQDNRSQPVPCFGDLTDALDEVVGGRSFLDPDAIALRAIFTPGKVA